MSKKRFTDIEIWDKEWYMELKPKYKCLMKYIFDKCDASGCWKPNWKLASLHIGEIVVAADLFELPANQYEVLENGKVFIPDFIHFQYGTLSVKSPAHNPVFLALEKNNLIDRVLNRLPSSLQEKEKEKETDKDKDIKGVQGGYKNDFVCYDVEKVILENRIEFERICIATHKDEDFLKKELRKYHLWLEKNEKYPLGKRAAIAGVESWILNGKNFSNGKRASSSVGKEIEFD